MHIVSLALGGCLKGEPVRYGITEDTGGHITYILGQMAALAARDDVRCAEIITRRFDDPRLGSAHARAEEWLAPGLVIRRIDSGDRRYLAKDELRRDREGFTAALIAALRARPRLPDLIHAHFADAADVAARIEQALGIPYVYTAHSLGLDKRAVLPGSDAALDARIDEEDRAIAGARAVIGSSRDECERQLLASPSARTGTVHRLIPGMALPDDSARAEDAAALVAPFLRDPAKPIVLAIARPVRKKNLVGLVDAFGNCARLREQCNLVLLAGLRDDLDSGASEQREVVRGIVEAVDRHDLYGSVAYPKSHGRREVDALYALAARSGGVFANPALIEPYGLTLVEAAAHGLPVVATRHGGPQDIIDELGHGLLVDPRDTGAIAASILRLVDDRALWRRCAHNARANSRAMSWDAYAKGFLAIARDIVRRPAVAASARAAPASLLVSDLDNTLTGCGTGANRFARYLDRRGEIALVVATGRSIVEARRLVRDWNLPRPRAWVTSVGTEIYIERGGIPTLDEDYSARIAVDWQPEAVDRALADLAGLVPQAPCEQRRWKRSYFADDPALAGLVEKRLADRGIAARVVFSHARLVDVLPPRAGKAAAMRHVARGLGVSRDRVFAAGDSGNDADMLFACHNAILVGNHSDELAPLIGRPNVYVARRSNALGALEGVLAHRRARLARQRSITHPGKEEAA